MAGSIVFNSKRKRKKLKEIYPPLTSLAQKARAAREVWGYARKNVTVFIIRAREMSKMIGGREGGRGEVGPAGAFENVVDRKQMTQFFHLSPN